MLPNLIVIGAPKAGTTSLHAYLGAHPEIFMSEVKELQYFDRPDWRERRRWYESQFESDAPVRGESTPAYAAHPRRPHVPERIAELIPDVRLIYLVRDPIDRLLSHWVQQRADADPTSLRRRVAHHAQPENPIVCSSRYGTQLSRYLEHFPPEQILVVDQHELATDRRATMRQVFSFLGVDESFESPAFETRHNTRADKHGPRRAFRRLWEPVLWPAIARVPEPARAVVRRPMRRLMLGPVRDRPRLTASQRATLEAHLKPEVDLLRELTGRSFAGWSI